MPDIAVVASDRLPQEDRPFRGVPDWLIEICSPDQSTLGFTVDTVVAMAQQR